MPFPKLSFTLVARKFGFPPTDLGRIAGQKRQVKIKKFYNKKEGKEQYRARFQLNDREFRPVADTRKKLLDMIDEIRAQEHRTKYELPVTKVAIPLNDLFEKRKKTIVKKSEKNIATSFRRFPVAPSARV